jgi:hypothetical protein
LIAIVPERPLSWVQVTRGLTPSNVSLPPLSLPLLAECTSTVPSRGGACADTGVPASSQTTTTATSPATVSRPGATQPRSIVRQPPFRATARLYRLMRARRRPSALLEVITVSVSP